jgi:hypothetical protein
MKKIIAFFIILALFTPILLGGCSPQSSSETPSTDINPTSSLTTSLDTQATNETLTSPTTTSTSLFTPTVTPSFSTTTTPSSTTTSTAIPAPQTTFIPSTPIAMSTTTPTPIVKGVNLLANPGFEQGSNGKPTGWTTIAWKTSTFIWDNTVNHSGQYSVKIDTSQPNDLRWAQTVNVLPCSKYKLTAWVKTLNVGHSLEANDIGASLRIDGTYTMTQDLKGTNDWTQLSADITTGSETTLTVLLRLGFTSGTNTGTVWFDDADLELIDDSYVSSFVGQHIILDLFRDDVNKFQDVPRLVKQLDMAYELFADLVGSTPYNGKTITIEEVLPMQYGGLSGNPIQINGQYFVNPKYPNELYFGLLHELGHDFDLPAGSLCYIGDGAINAEQWANFKVLYVTDQLAASFPDATTAPGYGAQILLGNLGTTYFVNGNSAPYLQAGRQIGLQMSGDTLTGLLYSLTKQIGWDPFKATFRDFQTYQTGHTLPTAAADKVQLLCSLLSKNSGVDLAPQFRSWGFTIQ